MKFVEQFISKQVNKVGIFGLIAMIFAWGDIVRAFIAAFKGDVHNVAEYVSLAFLGVLTYYFLYWMRDKHFN